MMTEITLQELADRYGWGWVADMVRANMDGMEEIENGNYVTLEELEATLNGKQR